LRLQGLNNSMMKPTSDLHISHMTNTDIYTLSLHDALPIFRDKKSGKEFYVEAKWRAGYYTRGNKIQWCNQNQLNRYKKLDKAERSEEHTSELQSRENLVCRLLLEKKNHP